MAKKLEHDNGTVRDASDGDDGDVSICASCGKPHHPSLECTCGGSE